MGARLGESGLNTMGKANHNKTNKLKDKITEIDEL
jgi:hypothetical protein